MTDRPNVLVIAGSDSSGGAGLQRDLQVLGLLGMDHASVVSAVTAQTDSAVTAIHPVPADIIAAQIDAALQRGGIGAVKIGMLGSRAAVATVARKLAPLAKIPIVLDPVLAASSGRPLLDAAGREALTGQLFPLATLITPNLLEAAELCGADPAGNDDEVIAQAEELLGFGPQAVLVKGGHGNGAQAVDVLVRRGQAPVLLAAPRLEVQMRGTGCALSSAIAAGLARGDSAEAACRAGKALLGGLLGRQVRRSGFPFPAHPDTGRG